ncbi:hypothetical protein BS50DRAFT_231124 [Corynespora cassiicola Philippines]|uniref:Uncharacterized protein n=1 Tax=Corynespora cassiicola Philippines TaxID=1448308 RepID=A0A2T2N1V5_CORCC|nr:hypothetical protein BS50DRAFT_231124 [Corynespora cassiicola Philippines]
MPCHAMPCHVMTYQTPSSPPSPSPYHEERRRFGDARFPTIDDPHATIRALGICKGERERERERKSNLTSTRSAAKPPRRLALATGFFFLFSSILALFLPLWPLGEADRLHRRRPAFGLQIVGERGEWGRLGERFRGGLLPTLACLLSLHGCHLPFRILAIGTGPTGERTGSDEAALMALHTTQLDCARLRVMLHSSSCSVELPHLNIVILFSAKRCGWILGRLLPSSFASHLDFTAPQRWRPKYGHRGTRPVENPPSRACKHCRGREGRPNKTRQ